MKKIIRVATVPISLNVLLKGQLAFLNQYYAMTAVSGAGADLDEVARREKIKVHEIEIERQISPLSDLKSLWKLYRFFKAERPDAVHSITPKAGLLSMLAARMAGVPVRMHTFTGLIFPSKSGAMQKLLILMDRLLCLAATNIYPEGNGVKQDLIQYGITRKPLKVLANGNVNGIDLNDFSTNAIKENQATALRSGLQIGTEDFVFIFVGRLVRDKGINELVDAFKSMKRSAKYTGVKLLLVGPFEQELDPLRPETLKAIEVMPDIITVGFQKDVRPYFAIADALVFPSYREGFPNVVLQAGAMGLPAIVTNINGCNEIITDGMNGLVIPAQDAEPLKHAMEQMVEDRKRYSEQKAVARHCIESRFSQELVWNALLEEYRRLLPDQE